MTINRSHWQRKNMHNLLLPWWSSVCVCVRVFPFWWRIQFLFSCIICCSLLQIVLTIAEHHSSIVPWQIVAQRTGAVLKFVNLTEDEVPDVGELKGMLSNKTKLVVLHHVSNVLGESNAVKLPSKSLYTSMRGRYRISLWMRENEILNISSML